MEMHGNYNLGALVGVDSGLAVVINVGCLIDAALALPIVGTSWDWRL